MKKKINTKSKKLTFCFFVKCLYESKRFIKQVEEEAELKRKVRDLLSKENYKFLIADEESLTEKVKERMIREGSLFSLAYKQGYLVGNQKKYKTENKKIFNQQMKAINEEIKKLGGNKKWD